MTPNPVTTSLEILKSPLLCNELGCQSPLFGAYSRHYKMQHIKFEWAMETLYI